MSAETRQEQNVAAVHRWIEYYNTDVHRMIDDSYAPDVNVVCPGLIDITDRAQFHEIEQSVLDAAPDRRARIDNLIAAGDHVIVEAVLFGTDTDSGTTWETPWCAILTFRDGTIVTDHTYLDRTRWPWVKDQKLDG
ncbi:nuclear transport factor 2 family protein [Micromonospora sp. HUAS LYJ1]|uniref:nuclear transport factor 2 family protein n=1 Tax=Micromonospora sp. HUAS LYJ1 TaxID=3061626 RepID=UPI002671BAAF|nr:nuclear transport factor 2 family protein [Micromonospora sp. HUAS LYJ1]WKU05584.1 nuclear transport factor 2 family protein [Micromonospora sp. HUAS LYJ1]